MAHRLGPGLIALAALAFSIVAFDSHGSTARYSPPVAQPTSPPLSVLTYNVHGLPWPLASGRNPAFVEIATRLRALRAAGAQPHVVVLQEAFTGAAKSIGAEAGYPFVLIGPSASDRAAP